MQYAIAACTDVGLRKKVNQDSLYTAVARTPLGQMAIAVVCDGVGGLSYGEIASAQVVLTFKNWFQNELPLRIKNDYSHQDIIEQWDEVIHEINQKLINESNEKNVQMGTTLTVGLFERDKYHLAQVGDSRAYEIIKQQKQLTKDQTLVARELEQGHLTKEEALQDKRKHILLQCIGMNSEVVPVYTEGMITEDANYLFCSDGFYNSLAEDEISRFCQYERGNTREKMEETLQQMIKLVKNRGERDNISAVMIKVMND